MAITKISALAMPATSRRPSQAPPAWVAGISASEAASNSSDSRSTSCDRVRAGMKIAARAPRR